MEKWHYDKEWKGEYNANDLRQRLEYYLEWGRSEGPILLQKWEHDDLLRQVEQLKRDNELLQARLMTYSGVKSTRIFHLVKGKVLIPVVPKTTVKDGLSKEFRAFVKKNNTKTDHHTDANINRGQGSRPCRKRGLKDGLHN